MARTRNHRLLTSILLGLQQAMLPLTDAVMNWATPQQCHHNLLDYSHSYTDDLSSLTCNASQDLNNIHRVDTYHHFVDYHLHTDLHASSAASSDSTVNPLLIGACVTLPIMATIVFMLCMRCREPHDADLEFYAGQDESTSPYVYYNPAAGADELPVANGGSHGNAPKKDTVILNPATLHLSTNDSIHYKSSAHNNNVLSLSKDNPVILTNIYYRHDL